MTSPVKVWRNQKKVARMLGKYGRIISWTVIRVPPSGFSFLAPYVVAVVKLTNGRNIIAQVVDCDPERIEFNQKVVTVVRKITRSGGDEVIPYGIKVKLFV